MRHGSLFSGIGGFDLAAQWMGWENVFQVEIDPFCQKVLAKNFPNTQRFTDIKEFDGTIFKGAVDIISGGFPCQPFSVSGKRNGTSDNRFLWPEMLRFIREVQPKWVLGENVGGIFTIENGLVFERIHTELENNDYEVQSFRIPACAVNAPHRRDRWWFIAHRIGVRKLQPQGSKSNIGGENPIARGNGIDASDSRCTYEQGEAHCEEPEIEIRSKDAVESERSDGCDILRIDRNTEGTGLSRIVNGQRQGEYGGNGSRLSWSERNWAEAATEFCGMDDGVPAELHKLRTADRVDRLKALGNSIVPQIAFEIFKAIEYANTEAQ